MEGKEEAVTGVPDNWARLNGSNVGPESQLRWDGSKLEVLLAGG